MARGKGSVKEFDRNWIKREETAVNFFRSGTAKNQIELTFQQHYSFMHEVVDVPKTGAVLDVGAGRGSMGEYFAADGYNVTLLDTSEAALASAQTIFKKNKHAAEYVIGDVLKMPFEDASFDLVLSIGLLEHFKAIDAVIDEQLRVLKKGGVLVAYVIPKRDDNVQSIFKPLNDFLSKSSWLFNPSHEKNRKQRVYRNEFDSAHYVDYLKGSGKVKKVQASGVYPLPEISYSFQFPFSFLPPVFESVIVKVRKNVLDWRREAYGTHPWGCEERLGQGFMVWATKR